MQYSPGNNMPTIAFADAGTVELVRSLGKRVISSAELVQRLSATIDADWFRQPPARGKDRTENQGRRFRAHF